MKLFAIREKQQVGWLRLSKTKYGDLELAYMKVLPEFRQRGIATSLLKRAIKFADKNNIDLIAFVAPEEYTIPYEKEIEWLKKHGFKHGHYNFHDNILKVMIRSSNL